MHDLLTDTRYRWQGSRNFVIIDPTSHPAHIFRVEEATASSDNGSVTHGAASAASVPAR
jgi:starch synthase (maltosyl-transferring)